MTGRQRRSAWALAVVAALALACMGEEPPAGTAELPAGRPDLPPPDQVVEDGEHIITVQGVKKAILRAEQLYFYNQTGRVIGDTIQVDFFDASGEFVSMLTAREGEIDQRTQDMFARGDVFVQGTDARIRTEELEYDPARNLIRSEKPTEIIQQGNVIRGQGVESDPALEHIRIRGGSAVLRSEPSLGPAREEPEAQGEEALEEEVPEEDAPAERAPAPEPPPENPPDAEGGGGDAGA